MSALSSIPVLKVDLKGRRGIFALKAKFEVPLEGISGLFGPSGSGKSTLLNAIAGLDRFKGTVLFEDEIWQNDDQGLFVATHKRGLGFVTQNAALFPHLTVRGNLNYGARRAASVACSSSMPGFDEIVAMLGLDGLLERKPASLSGGEKQRVALGRALLAKPRLLLLDEPLSALDMAARDSILGHIENLDGHGVVPMIYVSHDAWEVARLAKRVIKIDAGQCGGIEAPENMVDAWAPAAHARGETLFSLVKTRVVQHLPHRHISQLSLGRQKLVAPLNNRLIGASLMLRIRAREVAIALVRPENISIRNILEATITRITPHVPSSYVDVLLDIEGAPVHALISQDSLETLGLTEGQQVFALIKTVTLLGRG